MHNNFWNGECCGCSACALICPSDAISMAYNGEGYYSPIIEKDKCTSCELCRKVCIDEISKKASPLNKENVYVSIAVEKRILESSSSGGIGYLLAKQGVLASQIACGVTYSEKEENAKHIVVENLENIKRLQGSKYLQSDAFHGFSEAIEREQGIIFGTPCQVAGVDAVLKHKKIRNKFVLVDIFCHGVPSYFLWKNHLLYLKQKGKVKDNDPVTFREKKNFLLSIGKYSATYNFDAFYYFFFKRVGVQCFMLSLSIQTK